MQLAAEWEGYVKRMDVVMDVHWMVRMDVVMDVHWMVFPEGYFFWDMYLGGSRG